METSNGTSVSIDRMFRSPIEFEETCVSGAKFTYTKSGTVFGLTVYYKDHPDDMVGSYTIKSYRSIVMLLGQMYGVLEYHCLISDATEVLSWMEIMARNRNNRHVAKKK
jgi:hypothetical protein